MIYVRTLILAGQALPIDDNLCKPAAMTDALYKASYYKALHVGNDGDEAHYLSALSGPADVLELGCGAGRIALPLMESGHRLLGVDSHRGLLAHAEAAGVPTLEADFTTLEIEERFDHVILGYNGMYCLLSEAAVMRTLSVARDHLRPGGRFHFDVWHADPFHYDSPRADADYEVTESVGECVVDGRTLDVLEQSRWRPEEQRLDVSYLYLDGDDLIHTGVIAQRYLLKDQIESFLRAGGFSTVRIFGDFKRGPVTDESDHLVIEATV